MRKIAIALALACLGCTGRGTDGRTAPDFSLKDLDGKDVSLSAFRGKPVFLAFWAVG